MTTLTRVTGKVFGGSAPLTEIGVFGSAKAGAGINSQDVATIQGGTAYDEGWGSGIVTSENFPPMEEVTGVLKTISYQACYLLQEGIPVYDANTEYSATSIVKNFSGNILEFYKSAIDGNIGNPLTDNTKWVKAEIIGTRDIGVPQITLNQLLVNPPTNCIWLEGQELLRSDYPNLASIYDTTYNLPEDTDATKFRLPDFRDKYFCGIHVEKDNDNNDVLYWGYQKAGFPDLQLSTSQSGAHTHGGGTLNAQGQIKGMASQSSGQQITATGVFTAFKSGDVGGKGTAQSNYRDAVQLSTANKWTGATASSGAHTHTITSASSLVDNTLTTLKVDGIRIRVYTRYQ